MKLVVVSHKECWKSAQSPTGYVTVGGFPFQMRAISELFDRTDLALPAYPGPPPSAARPLAGHGLSVRALDGPRGSDLRRKAALLLWMPRNLPRIWNAFQPADAVHAAVPGDIGTIGLLLALIQRKPLFVRHCGTWGNRTTLTDRFLLWLLTRIAGGWNVVMATGGGESLPSRRNLAITWMFSTTLTKEEIQSIPERCPWRSGDALRLVTVGRLSRGKNTAAAVQALGLIRKQVPSVTLDVVGDGPFRKQLEALAEKVGVAYSVTFHGNLSHEEVMRVLCESHLFVFPTRVKEGFPKAVIEAMACSLPVIATRVSVIPHLLSNGSGVLLREPNAESLATSILDVISDEGRFADMASKAREASLGYTLERWRDEIGARLTAAWGPLRRVPKPIEEDDQRPESPGSLRSGTGYL